MYTEKILKIVNASCKNAGKRQSMLKNARNHEILKYFDEKLKYVCEILNHFDEKLRDVCEILKAN